MTALSHVTRGSSITLTVFFHDESANLVDVDDVTATIVDPFGASYDPVALPPIVHVALGQYEYTFDVNDAAPLGQWIINWIGVWEGDDETGSECFIVDPAPSAGRTCGGWVTVEQVRSCCTSLPASGDFSDEAVQDAIDVATDLLYTLSGAQFVGVCAKTIRPCARDCCFDNWAWGTWVSFSSWPNPSDPSSWPPRQCGCGCLPKVDLGYFPIRSVTQVKIDGEIVDPATYRLDEQRYLVRLASTSDPTSGIGWPHCQRLDLPDTEPDTWSVTFEYGQPAPPAGVNAAKKLACEIAKACAGIACELPGRVTNAVRQGVSFTLMDPSMLDNGLTGLYEVDLFLMAYNPQKSRGMTVVYSPDLQMPGWQTG